MKLISMNLMLLLILVTSACNMEKSETFWVNSIKKECSAGTGKMHCLQVSKNETLDDAEWTFFYNNTGGIKDITSDKLTFGPLASTRKMCMDMAIPDAFNVALGSVTNYKLKGKSLALINDDGQEVLEFGKSH